MVTFKRQFRNSNSVHFSNYTHIFITTPSIYSDSIIIVTIFIEKKNKVYE